VHQQLLRIVKKVFAAAFLNEHALAMAQVRLRREQSVLRLRFRLSIDSQRGLGRPAVVAVVLLNGALAVLDQPLLAQVVAKEGLVACNARSHHRHVHLQLGLLDCSSISRILYHLVLRFCQYVLPSMITLIS